jgi:16S rRNA G966 N2-methylase RsmD
VASNLNKSNLSVVKNKPKTTAFSDIDLNNWKDYDYIETGTLWMIPSRAKGAGHKLDYYGGYVPQIATQVFNRYTKEQEIVLDLFLGSGTTAVESMNMNRRCIGVELKKDLVNYVNDKIYPEKRNEIALLTGDSSDKRIVPGLKKVLNRMDADNAQLLILHPPYHDIIKFSDNAKDLSNAESTEHFLEKFEQVAQNGYDCLDKNRHAVLIIGDKYSKGELIPLSFLCMTKMNEVGFKTKSIIVKNIEGNEQGKGRFSNLWRYRALAGGFYIFKHEYVMIFQKK